jgi:BirA family biotin operon repressor/biotin-[acetyl-CoA-carboxylase] ligase
LELYKELNSKKIRANYTAALYRKDGFHAFNANDETFNARIIQVHPDGKLELETESGETRYFYFKEVKFIV